MELHSLKKKLALLLAVIMLAGVVTPFGMPPMQVAASAAGGLRAWTDQRLEGGTPGHPIRFVPMARDVTASTDILLSWPVTFGPTLPGQIGLHVLRFFMENGDKFELLLRPTVNTNELDVTFRLFSRNTSSPPDIIYTLAWYQNEEPLRIQLEGLLTLPSPHHYIDLRFLWEQGEFFLFIENGLPLGFIHEFELEQYVNTVPLNWSPGIVTAGAFYDINNQRHFVAQPAVADRGALHHHNIFVFPGFRASDVNIIPFAEARIPATVTPPAAHLTHGDLYFHTPVSDTVRNSHELSPNVRTELQEAPFFLDHPLDMTMPNPTEWPAMGTNGLDIRVLLPRFFDEQAGRFSKDFMYGVGGINLPTGFEGIPLRVAMGTPNASESFAVLVYDVTNPENYDLSATVSSGREQDDVFVISPPSILSTVVPDAHSIARIKVGGLLPSLVYGQMLLTMNPEIAVFANRDTSFAHGEGGLSFATLLEYRFSPPIAGNIETVVTPFRDDCMNQHRVGRYYFDIWAIGMPSTAPFVRPFTGLPDEDSHFHVPLLLRHDWNRPTNYFVSFIQPALERDFPRIYSQVVIVVPDETPTIGVPNKFSANVIDFRARRLPPAPGHPHVVLSDMDLSFQWDIGVYDSLVRMFESTTPGAFHDTVVISYHLHRNFAPVTDIADDPFAEVDVILTPVISGGAITALNKGYNIRFRNELPITSITTTPRAVVPLGGIVTASINLYDLVAEHINVPFLRAHHNWNNPFHFPAVYHFYVRPVEKQRGLLAVEEMRDWPLSAFSYITLNAPDTMLPPPPTDFTVRTTNDLYAPPILRVDFNVPLNGLRDYIAMQYEFAPLVYMNVYISADEAAIAELKHPNTDNRANHAPANTLSFASIAIDDYTVNLSSPASANLLPRLRDGEVVRIGQIPLMAANPFSPGTLFDGSVAVALEHSAAALATGLQAIPIHFNITGLDENQRYYLFADLVVERRVASGAALSWQVQELDDDGNPVYETVYETVGNFIYEYIGTGTPPSWSREPVIRRSVPTELSGTITTGTPRFPGPIEIDPSAPTGLDHMYLGQSYVTLFWDFEEVDDPYAAIEFEIIRVTDTRLNVASLVDAAGNPLSLSQIAASRADAVAWRTNVEYRGIQPPYNGFVTRSGAPAWEFLEVYRGASSVIHPLGTDTTDFRYHTDFESDELDDEPRVALTDRTLTPNTLYFYYVRTLRRVRFPDPTDPDDVHLMETRSSWVEESVTTPVVQPPYALRIEDGTARPGFDGQSQQFVSWRHDAMAAIIQTLRATPNEGLIFQYQFRIDGESWGAARIIPLATMIHRDSFNEQSGRFYFMVRGLDAGTVYQMRVRVLDRNSGDTSMWSNIITFMTDWDDGQFALEREADNWLEHLRRLVMEQLRQPFWIASDTPDLLRAVYRPDAFRGLLDAAVGGSVALHNTNARTTAYYLPISGILEANDHRRGFSTRYDDLDIVFAPRFLNENHNRAITDMARHVANRNMPINDYFARIVITRNPVPGMIHGNAALGNAADVHIDLVGVNTNTRNLRTWDTNMQTRAERMIDTRLSCPILRQNILNIIERGPFLGERAEYVMLDFIERVEGEIAAELNRMVTRDVPLVSTAVGIISPTVIPVTALNASMHVVATNNPPDMSVTGFTQVTNRVGGVEWQHTPVVEQAAGWAILSNAPGAFAFTGVVARIPGIENIPGGDTISTLLARFGIIDVFGHGEIDLHQNAARQMLTTSIARIAGAPANTDGTTWVANNLNITLVNRNATSMVAQQEAVAMVMALYERRTNTRVSSIFIRNHQHTAGMTLDTRYQQAVRAAFELGIITELHPTTPTTIGDFLNMLTALDARVGL